MGTQQTRTSTTGEVRGHPDVIDAAWLTDALEDAGVARGEKVLEVRSDGWIGTGQAARTGRLHLTWSDPTDRPASIVGKFPSDDESTRATIFATGSYFKEWSFYAELAPRFSLSRPTCLVARYDDPGQDFVLLMEDLAAFRPGDQLQGITADEMALAVEQAALFHAPYFGDPGLADIAFRNQPVTTPAEIGGFCEGMYLAALPPLLDRIGDEIDDEVRRILDAAAPLVARWFHGTSTPDTLIHNDFRADNLMFGGEGSAPIVVVDFQSYSMGPGGTDLGYLIGGSLADPAERASVERDLVEQYRARLAAEGIELGFDELWRDYRHGCLWGVIMSVMSSLGAEQTERGDEMFVAMLTRHTRQIVDLDALDVVER